MKYAVIELFNDELYFAKTEKGLCYVGNDFEELKTFSIKRKEHLTEDDAALSAICREYVEYAKKKRTQFTLPLDLEGTVLQRQVWQQLQKIPYGEVWSYSDVATALNKPTAVRAVANAIGKNPVLIAIPCHRVIGKNGKLTGFRSGLPLKKHLLAIEGVK